MNANYITLLNWSRPNSIHYLRKLILTYSTLYFVDKGDISVSWKENFKFSIFNLKNVVHTI